MNNEDEIEYFEFLPKIFTTDLQEALEETLCDIIAGLPPKIQTHITDSFYKKIFIFNNFVLRNILKFPSSFKLERKITDKFITTDVKQLIDNVNDLNDKIDAMKNKMKELNGKLEKEMIKNKLYKSLLSNKHDYTELCETTVEIKNFIKETNEMYDKYSMIGHKRESKFNKLMEYKNIKSEYYKKERDRLFNIATIDMVEHMNKQLL